MSLGVVDILIILAAVALTVWPGGRMFQRAGYSQYWAVLLLIPFVNLITLYVFAFAKWPVLNRRQD